jgi:hypothetical protein
MKKYVNLDIYIYCYIIFYNRLEKEYTVIRKEEQEEQVEIRVCRLYLIVHYRSWPFFFLEIKK